MQVSKKKHEDNDDDYDPATLAQIKMLEKGRQGFPPNELAKIKYSEIDPKSVEEPPQSESTTDHTAMADDTGPE